MSKKVKPTITVVKKKNSNGVSYMAVGVCHCN